MARRPGPRPPETMTRSLATALVVTLASAAYCQSARPNAFIGQRPTAKVAGHGPFSTPEGLTPAKVNFAYSIPPGLGSDAIAVVIPFHLPSALKDFNTFSIQYSYGQEISTNPYLAANKRLQVVFASGSQPPSSVLWGATAAMAIEYAHSVAPRAKIYLVEAASDQLPALYAAVKVAKAKAGVRQVILPWGTDEYAAEAADDATFLQSGVTFFASTGDFTGHLQYPAVSPNVVGVGGTNLSFSGLTPIEVASDSTAAGLSQFESRPSSQDPLVGTVGVKRGSPDLALVGDPLTSVAVYSDFALGGWMVMGGTSLAATVAAGIANVRGSFADGSANEIRRINQFLGTRFFRDITSGSAGAFSAKAGYDILTGAGSPTNVYSAVASKVYAPSSAGVEVGSLMSGSLSSLGAVDANTYNVASQLVAGTGQVAQVTADLPLDRPASQMVSINLQLTIGGNLGSTVQVYVWNWKTTSYLLAGTFPGTSSATTRVIAISKWSTLVDSLSNTIRVRVKSTAAGDASPTFTEGIDQLDLAGSY